MFVARQPTRRRLRSSSRVIVASSWIWGASIARTIRGKINLISRQEPLADVRGYWNEALGRLTKDLPDFDAVIADLRKTLRFVG